MFVYYRATSGDPWGLYGMSSGTVDVTTADPIIVTAPTGAGSYTTGDSLAVSWTARPTLATGEFSIWVVSPGNGWYVGKIVAADGSTDYADAVTLNVPVDDGYRVFVYHRANSGDPWGVYGSSPGTFGVSALGSLTLTAPNGGETIGFGAVSTVAWTLSQPVNVGSFDVWAASPSQGADVKLNAAPIATHGGQTDYQFQWGVAQAPASDYTLRVVLNDGLGHERVRDESNATFSVVAANVSVTAPNGGESVGLGTQRSVTWSVNHAVGVGSFDVYVWRQSTGSPTKVNTTPVAADAAQDRLQLHLDGDAGASDGLAGARHLSRCPVDRRVAGQLRRSASRSSRHSWPSRPPTAASTSSSGPPAQSRGAARGAGRRLVRHRGGQHVAGHAHAEQQSHRRRGGQDAATASPGR